MKLDTLVIGAGQAGLAAGYHLARAGRDFLIVDGAARVGDSWRKRYDSLTLFTPRGFSELPGKHIPGNREGYASRDEFAAYLEAYSAVLPLRLNASVQRLERAAAGRFVAKLSDGETLEARNAIVATGGFQEPVVPAFAAGLTVPQQTAETYRNPGALQGRVVLVVGDGASGRDIAAELAADGRTTLLATGKPRRLFPERLLGKSVWWWLDLLGILRASGDSWIGRRMREADAFPDRNRSTAKLHAQGVEIVGRVTGGSGNEVSFQDGSKRAIDAVVWCIGYRDRVDWIDIPGAHESGRFFHVAGVSPIPGLYFVGRPWQRNRASGLIMGVGDDAKEILGQFR